MAVIHLVYNIDRNAQTQAAQINDIQHVTLDNGELALFGLEVVPGSDHTTSPIVGTVTRALQVQPSAGSTFLTDYPTPDSQFATVTKIFQQRLERVLRCVVGAVPPF